jgi:micrococcal nuclease
MADQSPFYYRAELRGRLGKDGKERDPVVDGDTIDVLCDLGFDVRMQMRLRLQGINTPESRTRNRAEKVLGLAAKDFLKGVLVGADSIEFLSHEKGKYGRVLATLFVLVGGDRVNVNELLVKEGHARLYDGGRREPWT